MTPTPASNQPVGKGSIPGALTLDELVILMEAVVHEAQWCREEAYNDDPEWTQKAEALDAIRSKLESSLKSEVRAA